MERELLWHAAALNERELRTRVASPSDFRSKNSKGATLAMDRRDEITPLCSLCREDQVLEALTETQLMIVSL